MTMLLSVCRGSSGCCSSLLRSSCVSCRLGLSVLQGIDADDDSSVDHLSVCVLVVVVFQMTDDRDVVTSSQCGVDAVAFYAVLNLYHSSRNECFYRNVLLRLSSVFLAV